MRTKLLGVTLVAFLFGASSLSSQQSSAYNFITLDVDFPSSHEDLFGCAATDINDQGLIVGGCNDLNQNNAFRGFLYDVRRFSETDFNHARTDSGGGGGNIHNPAQLIAESIYRSTGFLRCSPFFGPKNSMLKVDRCLSKMGLSINRRRDCA